MRIAVLSDIHGNLPALQAVLDDVAREAVDAVVNLGDLLSGPLLPAETADFLMARDFVTIAGNHERQLLKARSGTPDPATSDGFAATRIGDAHAEWVRSLPAQHWLADDVLLVHGSPGSDLEYWLETVTPGFGVNGFGGQRPATADEVRQRLHRSAEAPRASLILCGHTHVPRAVQCGGTLIINPGSVGLQAYEDEHPHRHRMEIGSPHARYALVERAGAGWRVGLRSVPYDWDAAARLAADHGRPDWAHALATGRMPQPTIAP